MMDAETKRKIRELAIPGMLDALDLIAQDPSYAKLTFDEKMKVVVDYSYQEKRNDQVTRLIRNAHLRLPQADISNIDYEGRPLSRELVNELGTAQFVSGATDVILEGFTGTGNYAGIWIMLRNGLPRLVTSLRQPHPFA